ncbi:MAG: hypothetical protein RMM98_07985 [Acidobacteriota bacterium]|nr:hypothetical protein [Blastocatellia bacterium]MDW8239539.1 hypothetical protein [Acidobacteriota bacterium]
MKRTVVMVVLMTLCQMSMSFAQSPQPMRYQGVLTDAQGRPLPDGPVSLTFRLYDVAAGGTALWEETQPVTVTSGVFSVMLGRVKPLDVPPEKPYWLGITVGNGAELAQRAQLTASRRNLRWKPLDNSNLIPNSQRSPCCCECASQRGGVTKIEPSSVQLEGPGETKGGDSVLSYVDHKVVITKNAPGGQSSAPGELAQRPLPVVLYFGRDMTGSNTAGAFLDVSGIRPSLFAQKRPPGQSGKLTTTDVINEQQEILNQSAADAQTVLPVELSQFLQQQQSNPAIWGHAAMPDTGAILGQISLTTSTSSAVRGVHQGLGVGVLGQIANSMSTAPAVWGVSDGTGSGVAATMTGNGTGLLVDHNGATGNLAVFRSSNANRVRFDKTGRGFFNGGTQNSGADVAEAFEVEGSVHAYEPGDVLVISTRTDRTVEKSREPYSTLVAGVYSTKSGVLLTERSMDDAHEDTVPLGIVGVIPTKVSAENGPIRRGDLLVTSSLPGHAMKATDQSRLVGAVLGKALENFDGQGTGVIRVLVSVK